MSYIGMNKIGGMYLGDTKIGKAYLGDDLVYSAGPPPIVEKPDCIRIDFSTTSDNVTFTFGYCVGIYTSYIELDGSRISFTKVPDLCTFSVPTSGEHTAYIKPSQQWPSNWGFGYFNYCDYIRFPYNTSTMIKCPIRANTSTNKWAKIDILDSAYISEVKSNRYSTFSRSDKIRVPKGSKQLYESNSVSTTILDKMSEYNFNYEL